MREFARQIDIDDEVERLGQLVANGKITPEAANEAMREMMNE